MLLQLVWYCVHTNHKRMKLRYLCDHHGHPVPLDLCPAVVFLFLPHVLRVLGALVRGLAVLRPAGPETPSRQTFYHLKAVNIQVRVFCKKHKVSTSWLRRTDQLCCCSAVCREQCRLWVVGLARATLSRAINAARCTGPRTR